MNGAEGLASTQSPLQGLAHGELSMWGVSVCVYMSVFLCVITSVGLAARFMVELVGVDNSIREETDLEAEWRRRREMTAWSSSDQYCLVMTPWCVHQGHTKQTRPPFIGLHHLHLCSVVSRLTGSLYGLHWGIGWYLLRKVYVIGFFSCPFHCICLCVRYCFRTGMNFGLHRGMLVCRQLFIHNIWKCNFATCNIFVAASIWQTFSDSNGFRKQWCGTLANSTKKSSMIEIELAQMHAHLFKAELRNVIVHIMDTVCLSWLLTLSISLCCVS